MLGAIVGDVIGSVYEFHPVNKDSHWNDFPLFTPKSKFTDDTVMTLTLVDALAHMGSPEEFENRFIDSMHDFGKRWPHAGYGGRFRKWLKNASREPYNSFGNGSAMRVSPAGWDCATLAETEELARRSAAVTHNHPEGLKGAQAVAGCIFLARNAASKDELRNYASSLGYNLARPLAEIQHTYNFDETCQGSVPEAIIAFLESENFEDAIRKAIWLGGDADTQAAITGSIAEAFYQGVPEHLATPVLQILGEEAGALYRQGKTWLDNRNQANKPHAKSI